MSELQSNSLAGQRLRARPEFPIADATNSTTSQYQTLSGILHILRARWKTVAGTAIVVFALGTVVCFLIRAYSATTIIEVNKDDPSDNDGAQTNGPALSADDIKDEVATDVGILETDDGLTLSVVKRLNLLQEPSFKKAIVESEKNKPLDQAPKTRDRVLKMFRGRLKVDTPTDTRLITITFKSSDPVLAAKVSNTLANTFIDDTLARRQASILKSSSWLQHELADLQKKVQESEQKLADYERNAGLAGIELSGTASGNGSTAVSVTPENTVTTRLFALNQELTTAEANRISAETVYKLVQNNDPEAVLGLGPMSASNGGGAGAVTPQGIALVSSLRAQAADLSRQYSAAAVKYGSNNPRLVELQEQIDSVKKDLQAELGRIRTRAASDYNYARQNEATIRAQFAKQQDAADSMADKSVKLQLLAQEAFSNRALYQGLFSKLQTATLASGTRATRISVVDLAVPSGTPAVPKWGLYLAALFLISLFIGVSVAFFRESLDETIRTSSDFSEIYGLSMLGYIPRLQLTSSGLGADAGSQLIESPRSPFSESIRALRTSINLTVPPTQARHFLVTSALGGDGKTTVTFNLGVAFAQQGARVLLIDGDLRNPDLHRLFRADLSPGLSDACKTPSSADMIGIVQHSTLPSLYLLPAGVTPELPSEIFASDAFDILINRLKGHWDYILVDSPPILAVTDASIIASKMNATIAVIRSRRTTRPVVASLLQALHRAHAPAVNFVLNDVQHPTLDGFYDYSYSRGKDRLTSHA
jgi:succinoglycan biosynthesis transport protein ExoP